MLLYEANEWTKNINVETSSYMEWTQKKNIKFSVLRLSLCCVLWGASCLLFVYVRHFSKHFYSIIFTEALWKCFYMKNWNLYFIFHHEKYCWMDFYKYAFCFLRAALWRWLFFLDCFTLPLSDRTIPSKLETEWEAFKVSYFFFFLSSFIYNFSPHIHNTHSKLLFEVWTSLLIFLCCSFRLNVTDSS